MLDFLQTNVRRSKDGECLIWAGSYDRGRPVIWWNGKRHNPRRLLLTLRGELPAHHQQWSTCGHLGCISDEHLKHGTPGQMSRFFASQGRMLSGTARVVASALARQRMGAKLPVREFANVARMRGEGMLFKDIAAHYGVSVSRACQAWHTWNNNLGGNL